MKIGTFLVINSRGSVKVLKSRPSLSNDEIAVYLDINVPKEFFERMMPTVEIDLPKEAIINTNMQAVIRLTAETVGQGLKIDVGQVEDMLYQMIKDKEEQRQLEESETNDNGESLR